MFAALWKKTPCISPMLIWWRRYFTSHLAPGVCPVSRFQPTPPLIICSLVELRWGRRRSGGGRKRENIRGETLKLQPCCRSRCFFSLPSSALLSVSARRKRKWRSRRCCISKPGCTTAALQRWFSRWSAPAKVGLTQWVAALCLNGRFWCTGFHLLGRLGAMVTVTLQLGISILNGGNILVQQVNNRRHFV